MSRLLFGPLLSVLLALSIAGCSGGDEAQPPPTVPTPATFGSIRGIVVAGDTSMPLSNARVQARGVQASTAADGSFVLDNVPSGARAIVRVAAGDYAEHIVVTDVAENQTSYLVSRMSPVGATITFDASSANPLAVPDSTAQVSIGPGTLIDASTGATATGLLTAQITTIDPALDPANMPGEFATSNPDGSAAPLASFGALRVEFRDTAGRQLNLAPGRTASIRIALATRSATPPASVPLYYLNETTGRWVEDGTATLQGTGPDRYYAATVSHFSAFNADFAAPPILYNSCVEDVNHQRIADAAVRSEGLDYSGLGSTKTASDGKFSVPVARGGRASVSSIAGSRISNAVVVGPSDVDIESPVCLQLVEPDTGTAPLLLRQPADVTVPAGTRAEFHVFVQSVVPARYQWQRNGEDIPGATGSYFAIPQTSAADDRDGFRVIVTVESRSTTSRTATLTLADSLLPIITEQPQNVTVIAGGRAGFSVSASGENLHYQWRRNGLDIGAATTASYTIPATTLDDDGAQFSVSVGNASGSIDSTAALLTVQAAPSPPTIAVQPQNATVAAGETASFSVVAAGASLRFQWERDGNAITGATQPSYTTPAVTAGDNGARFRVIVTNDGGSTSSAEAVLSVEAGGANQQLRIVRLLASTADLGAIGSMVDLLMNANDTLRTPAGACRVGSVTETLNGAPVVGGEALPLPVGTLAATFAGCRLEPGANYDGAASMQYGFSAANRLDGTVQATLNHLRRFTVPALAATDTTDITTHGGFAYSYINQASGSAVTRLMTINPAAGSTLSNNKVALNGNFTTGGMSIRRSGTVDTVGVFTARATRYSYSSLIWNIDSAAYVADGFYEFGLDAAGAPSGTGEVLIKSGQVAIGRIYANAEGVFVEAGDEVQPL